MMKLSPTLQTVFNTVPINFFHVLKITNDAGTVLKAITTAPHAVTIDSQAYTTEGTILSLDAPKTSATVDREQYKIQIADPSFAYGSLFQSVLIGAKVEVRMCFLDPTTRVPILTIADTLLAYSGRIDGVSFIIKTSSQGEVVAQLMCSSPMANLDHKKAIFVSRDYIRGRNPDDASCDFVYGGSGAIALKWGKS